MTLPRSIVRFQWRSDQCRKSLWGRVDGRMGRATLDQSGEGRNTTLTALLATLSSPARTAPR